MTYTAKQGDIIWLDFDPQTGNEQKRHRPVVVISNIDFNTISKKAAFVCPITSSDRGLPHHICLDNRTKTSGVILTDQAKILDISRRRAKYIEALPVDLLLELVDIVYSFMHITELVRNENR